MRGGEVMERTSESPRTENGTRAISNDLVVTDNDAEIAKITMSITTLSGFREELIGEILKRFAEASRSFYLEAGNKLKSEP